MSQAMPEVHDSEVIAIEKILERLRGRYQKSTRSYQAFEREATDLFGQIGFTVSVNWHRYSVGGVEQEGAMPEISVTGRTTLFDPDRQVHEVTRNILELPGQDGVIKTDQGDVFKSFRSGGGLDHGHSHPH